MYFFIIFCVLLNSNYDFVICTPSQGLTYKQFYEKFFLDGASSDKEGDRSELSIRGKCFEIYIKATEH